MVLLTHGLYLVCALGLLWTAANLFGRLFQSVRLPRVIGEIMGGLILGPTLLLRVFAEPLRAVFNTGSVPTAISIVTQIGLVLLMFASGTHLRTFVDRKDRKLVLFLAVGGVLIPFGVGLLTGQFFDTSKLQGAANHHLAFHLVFATAIAIASIPVISRIMTDLGIMETPFARIVISTAAIDDLVLYVVLAIALGMVQPPTQAEYGLPQLIGLQAASGWATSYHVLATIGLIAAVLTAGPLAVRFFKHLPLTQKDNGFVVQAIFLTAVTAAGKFLNVNLMFSALAAGMVVGRIWGREGTASPRILDMAGKIFIPIYLAVVGFKLDLIRHFDVGFFLAFLAFACLVKAASIYLSARAAGEPRSNALNLAAALNARGGPGIVLASVAYQAQIINDGFYCILVLTAVVTSLMAGAWLAATSRKSGIATTDSALWKSAQP